MTTVLLYLAGSLLLSISWGLGQLSFILPDGVGNSITYFFSLAGYINPIFPIATLYTAIARYLQFALVFAIIKIIIWAYHKLPFISPKGSHHLPEL